MCGSRGKLYNGCHTSIAIIPYGGVPANCAVVYLANRPASSTHEPGTLIRRVSVLACCTRSAIHWAQRNSLISPMATPISSHESTSPSPADFLLHRINYERTTTVSYRSDFKLDRMRRLMHLLGDPQDRLKAIHIAGTKGKGSTAAMIAAVLQAGGLLHRPLHFAPSGTYRRTHRREWSAVRA